MANVKSVTQREKGALIHLEDPQAKPIWTPEYDLAVALIGKPIPNDWTEREGPYGPQVLPPKKGGGGVAYRNTKEGMEAEQRSIHASVALQHAREMYGDTSTPQQVCSRAEVFYRWLQEVSRALVPRQATDAAQGPAQAVPGPSQTSPAAGVDGGERGRAAAPQVPGLGSEPAVGDTSSPSSGEASAASVEPGVDDSGEGVPLGSTRFPYTPEACDQGAGAHKAVSGHWLKTVQIDGKPHCPRCGMSALLYRESDVGP